jgi:hypothetical protein
MRKVRNDGTSGKIMSIHDRGGGVLVCLFVSLVLFR